MKRVRFLAMLINFHSISAVAGYECLLQFAHTENLNQVISEKVVQVDRESLISKDFGTVITEEQTRKMLIGVNVRAVMSGEQGGEDATFVMMRTIQKKNSSKAERISENFTLKGNDDFTGWFDAYKVDISCRLNGKED